MSSNKSAGLRRLHITEDNILTPNLMEAEDTVFNACMPVPTSVISEEKLIDELENKLEAPLVPLVHNTNTDDSDSNHILKEQEPEPEPETNGTNGIEHQKEDIKSLNRHHLLGKKQLDEKCCFGLLQRCDS